MLTKKDYKKNGCNDDCFNCLYADCYKPSGACVNWAEGTATDKAIKTLGLPLFAPKVYPVQGRCVLPSSVKVLL